MGRQILQEAYKVLLDPVNQSRPEVKLGAISRIQATISFLANLRPDLETLGLWEQLEELHQAYRENRFADNILPTGKHVPFGQQRHLSGSDLKSDSRRLRIPNNSRTQPCSH